MQNPKPVGIIPFIAVYLVAALFLPLGNHRVSSQEDTPTEVDSKRIANYQIDVTLNADTKTLEAAETITWTNPSHGPADKLMLHLYMNAFRSPNTHFMEHRSDWKKEEAGWIDILRLLMRLPGEENYLELRAGQYIIDETVMTIPLPDDHPISYGQTVELKIDFRVQLPRIFSRTGYSGNYFMVAQWFPKMGVFLDGRWVCPQYHRHSEYFADFGEYSVRISVPKNFRIGATGVLESSSTQGESKVYLFRTEKTGTEDFLPVHDFAWAASPDFRPEERKVTYQANGGKHEVALNILMQRDRLELAPVYEEAVSRSLARFGSLYGPYPYSYLTIIDPGPGRGQGSGGMEYPMLITGGSTWLETVVYPGGKQIEGVTAHEFAHQYWYGVVANDEFNEAWLDEGLTTYTSDKVIDSFGPADDDCRYLKVLVENLLRLHPFRWDLNFDFESLAPLLKLGFPSTTLTERRERFIEQPDADPITTEAYRPFNYKAYWISAYDKPALALRSLEYLIGEETVQRVLGRLYRGFKFKHPSGADFMNLVDEAAGEDMSWFFRQVWEGTGVLDYAVTDIVTSETTDGSFQAEITIERLGEVAVPQVVRLTFADGSAVDFHQWQRKDLESARIWEEGFSTSNKVEGLSYRLQEGLQGRWLKIAVRSGTPVGGAQVDPDYGYLLDSNLANNSYIVEQDTALADRGTLGWIRILSRLLHGMSAYN
jgi:hypothetical protein